mmetsp:Transcript_8052/g.11411  ORF Transcript_8052/g.11411 Transcript_8052/m.11411 type:complete len:220 (+) Transcript_8052:321-980(+)
MSEANSPKESDDVDNTMSRPTFWWGIRVPNSFSQLASTPKSELLSALGCVSEGKGLSSAMVKRKQKTWGPNKLLNLKRADMSSLARAFAQIIPPLAIVRREGSQISIPSDELVPGDIVILKNGDQSPADIRLLKILESDFTVDQSALNSTDLEHIKKSTEPAQDDGKNGAPQNVVLLGMYITSGKAVGIVMSTGRNTLIGLKCEAEGLFEDPSTCCTIL